VEAYHQQIAVGRQGHVRREIEVHRLAQTPGIGGMGRVKQRHVAARDVLQFEVLVGRVVLTARQIRRWYMISLMTTGPIFGPVLLVPSVRSLCATKKTSPTLFT